MKPFAGIISLEIKQDGLYRISAGDRVWFDVINAQTKQIVQASSFEMQPPCNKIFKIVTFDLQAGTNYILQISSSAKPESTFLFSKHP